MDIEININSFDTQELLRKLQLKQNDWTQELYDIGVLMLRSIDLNFDRQGRPTAWTPSQAAQKRNGMTLVDTGRLRRSVSILGDPDNLFDLKKTSLKMSTDVDYAKYLHEERPFLVVQDEDLRNMEQIVIRGLDNL
jgi:phage gpG-like protein